jgi:hypothetical protein
MQQERQRKIRRFSVGAYQIVSVLVTKEEGVSGLCGWYTVKYASYSSHRYLSSAQ